MYQKNSTLKTQQNSLESRLQNITIDEDDTLLSVDEISLFTNIPIYLAIKNITEKWDNVKQHTTITKQTFLKILNFCLRDNNYFKYMDNTYIQTFGMPM